jgi:hypothetical protein
MDLHCKYFEEKEPIWNTRIRAFPGDYAVLSPADLSDEALAKSDLADLRRIAAVNRPAFSRKINLLRSSIFAGVPTDTPVSSTKICVHDNYRDCRK